MTSPDARTNSVSTIELTADSEIAIGAGSVLNVANVAGTAWTAKTKLNFVGPEGPNAVNSPTRMRASLYGIITAEEPR